MARITESSTEYESTTNSQYHSESTSKSESQSQSTTQKLLDGDMLGVILSGLEGQMTDEEIRSYAQGLLEPQKNAELEASRQKYEAAKLSREQEIESLAASLQRSIAAQKNAYRQSAADVQTILNKESLEKDEDREAQMIQREAPAKTILKALDDYAKRLQESIDAQREAMI